MSITRTQQRDERLQKLFADCQQQVISQIIGPFGLSTAMFEDRNGGNVTTLHNFSRDNDEYIATDTDKILHKKSKEDYDREQYELKQKDWQKQRDEKITRDKEDGYTGAAVSMLDDGIATITLSNGTPTAVEIDHVVSIKQVHETPKMHLGLGQVQDGKADVSRIQNAVNDDRNLVLTNKKLNASKKDKDLKEWMDETHKDTGETKAQTYAVDQKRADDVYKKANKFLNSTADIALLKKQTLELAKTGLMQAAKMTGRQALGVLLTELVNGLFNEFKFLIRHGIEAGKTIFDEITQRLKRVAVSVTKKIPDALSQGFQGGISGFISNLLTFLINNFLSTAKRYVTIIREGLIGLYNAFKIIFFPPAHMTPDQALQEGIKALTLVVTTAAGLFLQESVKVFVATVPLLVPIAEVVTSVLIGIVTGLLAAFLAYQIDSLFDRLRHSHNERMMDQYMTTANGQEEFSAGLIALVESSLENVRLYSASADLYAEIGDNLQIAQESSEMTLDSLRGMVKDTQEDVKKSHETIEQFEASQAIISDFLDKR